MLSAYSSDVHKFIIAIVYPYAVELSLVPDAAIYCHHIIVAHWIMPTITTAFASVGIYRYDIKITLVWKYKAYQNEFECKHNRDTLVVHRLPGCTAYGFD